MASNLVSTRNLPQIHLRYTTNQDFSVFFWSFNESVKVMYLDFELPRVSSRSSEPHSSCIISPSQGFTRLVALLPNANSFGITWDIGISAVSATTGEHVPLCPGVHMRDPLRVKSSILKPNGFEETRLNVGEVDPLWGTWVPAYHFESGSIWRPGLGGVDKGRNGPHPRWAKEPSKSVLIRGVRAVGELEGGVTGALMEPPCI